MEGELKEYIDSCAIYQGAKSLKQRPAGVLQSLPPPQGPWQELTMDFITGLPLSKRGDSVYDAILVVVDRYTKMARYIPTQKTATATELADLFVEHIVRFFGLPIGIVSDRGSLFTSQFWADLCFVAKVKRRLSTAFHPQTDGQTERQNQTLEQYLRSYVGLKQEIWVQLLPLAEFAYNNSHQPTIRTTPFYACYGFHPRLDCEPTAPIDVPMAADRITSIVEIRKTLQSSWEQATKYQADYYNARHRPQVFCPGDKVLLSTKNLRLRTPSRKLTARYIGPFVVEENIGSQAYRLTLPAHLRIHPVFHTSLLKPYIHREGEPELLPGPVVLDDGDTGGDRYVVEAVLARKKTGRQVRYLVKWEGWTDDYNQWVLEEDVDKPLIDEWKSKTK
jgi:transposase InsO family protein